MNSLRLWAALCVAGVVAGLVAARIPRDPPLPPGFSELRGLSGASSNLVLAVKMERCSEQAMLDAWSRYGILLRPSVEFLPACEAYLERVSKDARFQAASEQDRLAEALIAGGFIGEAMRRRHGGAWIESDPGIPTAGPFALQIDGKTVWPVNWAQKRLFNGTGDNVHHKYLATVTGQTNGLNLSVTVWNHAAGDPAPPSSPASP